VKKPRKLVALVGRDVTQPRIECDLSTDRRHRGIIIVRDHYELDRLRGYNAEGLLWLDWGASPMQKEFIRAARLGEPATIEQAREALHG
jgi:hypothetical protein